MSDKIVSVSLKTINKVLGRTYTLDEIKDVFTGLSFEYSLKGTTFKVSIPKRRPDIETYQDLIEEIVRINGYDKIDAVIPPSTSSGHLSNYQAFVRKIRHILSYNLNETITYSLTTQEKATYFDNKEYGLVKIMNPLSDDRIYLRHSTLPSLIEVVKYNQNRKTLDNFLFEIGRRYTLDSEEAILSGILTGTISNTLWKGEKEEVDFFYVKGLIENLFNKLGVKNYSIQKPIDALRGLHPGVSASILIGREEIGFIGRLHPDAIKYFDCPMSFVFEFSLEKLFAASHPLKTVKEISKYPFISRDLALVMDSDKSCEYLISCVKKAGKRTLTDVKVFDLFTGQSLGENKKQIALKLIFQDMNRTLETAEVDDLVEQILSQLEKLGITLRS